MPPVVDGRAAMTSCRMARDQQQVGYQLSNKAFVSHATRTVTPDTNDVTNLRHSDPRRTCRKAASTRQEERINTSTHSFIRDDSDDQRDSEVFIAPHAVHINVL